MGAILPTFARGVKQQHARDDNIARCKEGGLAFSVNGDGGRVWHAVGKGKQNTWARSEMLCHHDRSAP
jgi:hypothetical protein